jgi:hypothetical protein
VTASICNSPLAVWHTGSELAWKQSANMRGELLLMQFPFGSYAVTMMVTIAVITRFGLASILKTGCMSAFSSLFSCISEVEGNTHTLGVRQSMGTGGLTGALLVGQGFCGFKLWKVLHTARLPTHAGTQILMCKKASKRTGLGFCKHQELSVWNLVLLTECN